MSAGWPVKLANDLQAYELLVELDAARVGSAPISIDVLASDDGREFTRLIFDAAKGRVSVDKSKSTLSSDNEGPLVLNGEYASDAFGPMRSLRVIVDGSVIQVFVNDAAAYAVRSYPSLAGSTHLRLAVPGTQPVSASVQMWPLRRPPG